jgi:hypothetical protein
LAYPAFFYWKNFAKKRNNFFKRLKAEKDGEFPLPEVREEKKKREIYIYI